MVQNGRTQLIAGLDWVKRKRWPKPYSGRMRRIRLVDLFCGCGGLTLGVWEAARRCQRRLDIRLAVDSCEDALTVYRSNFKLGNRSARLEDIMCLFGGEKGSPPNSVERELLKRLGTVDLMVAGPPCQGHSDLNNSTRRSDPRNSLYLCVARAAEILRPKAIIIENVPAVLLDKRRVVAKTVRWLRGLGYHVSDDVLLLSRFAVPQLRKRHILVACSGGPVELAELQCRVDSEMCAGDFLDGLEDMVSTNGDLLHRAPEMTPANRRRVDYLFDKDKYDLPDRLRPNCHKDGGHSYVSMYGRMFWDRPAQTLTSGFGSMGQGRYVHPKRRRLLTPHEAARLQGFPDFFDFTSARSIGILREMIANAVPPQLTATLVTHLIREGLV